MNFDRSTFAYLLLGILGVLAILQIFSFSKLIQTIKQLSRMLFEIRLLFKKSGIYYNQHVNRVIEYKSCQFCRHRMSFIQSGDESEYDGFYYRCKQRNIEITLHDQCEHFDRDFGTY